MAKIINIIPAPGMLSMYKGEENRTEIFPLVCWALVEDEHGSTRVTGMDASNEDEKGINFCESDPDFVGYLSEQEAAAIERSGGNVTQ